VAISGYLKTKLKRPHVYVIVKRHCIYIGETQGHPTVRWGKHFELNGTFSVRLRENDEELASTIEDVFCAAYELAELATIAPEEWRLVSQFIEHKLHEKIIANLGNLAPLEKVISDTSRTAPRACRHLWAKELVNTIYEDFVGSLYKGYFSKLQPL
jgi:hypothetical protein